MSFYEKLRGSLSEKLTGKELEFLPRSYLILGKLMLIKLKPKLVKHRKMVGETIKEIFPYIDAVFLEKSIEGIKRKPKVELIAGEKKHSGPITQTIHTEHGCKFMLDVSEVMWSKGNKGERQRIKNLVKGGEVVVDMFAGIGYFSIFIAKYAAPKVVYDIEINPKSIEYLEKNAFLNNVQSKIEILKGDCRKYAPFLEGVADRILMGYVKNTKAYLPAALRMAKKGTIIHFHDTVKKDRIDSKKKEILGIIKKKGRKARILAYNNVKSYAPNVFHVVFDIKLIS